MSAREPDDLGGLTVTSLRDEGKWWYLTHTSTGTTATHGYLRQRRFAELARADLLATGVDFTGTPREIGAKHAQWAPAYYLWRRRADQRRIDLVTGEYYSADVRYGQVVPSAANAARLAAALQSYVWS